MSLEKLDPYQKKVVLKTINCFMEAMQPILEIIIEVIKPLYDVIMKLGKRIASLLRKYEMDEVRIRLWWYQYQSLRGIE